MPMIEEQITESIQTGAPSIKYEQGRDQIASMPDVDAELYQMYLEALKEGQLPPSTDFKTYKDMMMQIGQQQVEPGQGIMQDDRAMAAYGGLMGADGRKKYGIGSFFQKYIKDPIEMAITGKTSAQLEEESQARVDREPEGYESFLDTLFKGKKTDPNTPEREPGFFSGLGKAAIPIIGGGIAGLFSQDQEEENSISGGMGTGIGIQNVGKAANLLSPTEASAAGLRFSPELSTRKYSPAEMAVAYGNENIDPLATANLAQGGRIGYSTGANYNKKQVEMLIKKGADNDLIKTYSDGILDDDINQIRKEVQGLMRNNKAQGGMLNLGGMEKDYRSEGGFVPIGEYEKKDDVPARLSVNEFVFTADAVRGAGEGDVDAGAKKLEGLMSVLEKKGKRSGAKEMFSVSERIGEVI